MKKIQICTKIKQARKEEGYSREALSELVGVTSTTVQRWENGTSRILYEDVVKLAKVLNKSLEYFSGENQAEKKEIDAREALELIAFKLGYGIELREIPSNSTSAIQLPDDIAEALLMADEADLRTIRNVLRLPIPKTNKKAN